MEAYLTYLYVFSLIVGGMLLLASILFGGKELEADGGAEADFDADLDADVDADVEGDFDLDGDGGHAGHAHLDDVAALGPGRRLLRWLGSVRFWTFFLTFFAATGLAVQGLGLVDHALVGFALAVGMGLLTGGTAASVTRWLEQGEAAEAPKVDDYIGKSVRVLLPVRPGGTGKVRLQLRGQTVDVLATTDEEEAIGPDDEVIIVEMEGHVARVARLGRREERG